MCEKSWFKTRPSRRQRVRRKISFRFLLDCERYGRNRHKKIRKNPLQFMTRVFKKGTSKKKEFFHSISAMGCKILLVYQHMNKNNSSNNNIIIQQRREWINEWEREELNNIEVPLSERPANTLPQCLYSIWNVIFFRFFHFFSSNILFWLWDSFSTHDGLFMFWFIWWENFLSLHFFFLRFSCCSSWANHMNALCSFFIWKKMKGKKNVETRQRSPDFAFFFGKCLFYELINIFAFFLATLGYYIFCRQLVRSDCFEVTKVMSILGYIDKFFEKRIFWVLFVKRAVVRLGWFLFH